MQVYQILAFSENFGWFSWCKLKQIPKRANTLWSLYLPVVYFPCLAFQSSTLGFDRWISEYLFHVRCESKLSCQCENIHPNRCNFSRFFFNTWFMLPLLLRETKKSTTRGCTAIASASKRKRRWLYLIPNSFQMNAYSQVKMKDIEPGIDLASCWGKSFSCISSFVNDLFHYCSWLVMLMKVMVGVC